MEVQATDKAYRLYMDEHLKFLMDLLKDYYYKFDFINYARTKNQIDQLRSVMNSMESKASSERSMMCED